MKRILIAAAAIAVALSTSACITVIDADGGDTAWHGENAQPFDAARDTCRASTGGGRHDDAFVACMAAKGWTRG